jgi:hypothetical protein
MNVKLKRSFRRVGGLRHQRVLGMMVVLGCGGWVGRLAKVLPVCSLFPIRLIRLLPFYHIHQYRTDVSGRVRMARNRTSKMYAAMKVIDKNGPPRESVVSLASSAGRNATRTRTGAAGAGAGGEEDPKIRNSTDREVVIMKLIQHPNILQIYDVYESTESM